MNCGPCSICRGDSSTKNPLEYITPTPSPTIGDYLRQLGLGVGDDGIRAALKELATRRAMDPQPRKKPDCGCHCTGGCGDPYAACMYPCEKHIPF